VEVARKSSSTQRLRWLSSFEASFAALATAYFVAGKLGLRLAFLHASATPVWPPTGIALGALLIGGYRLWPAIFLAAFLVNLTTAGSLATSAGIAVGNTAEALAGAYLVNRFARGRHAMERFQDIFRFALLAGGLSTTVSATLGVASLTAGGLVEAGTHARIWATWWLGDVVGALMVTPLLLLWCAEPRLRLTRAQALEATGMLLAVVLGGLVMFGRLVPPYSLTFLCLPLLLWPAFRLGPRESATAAVVLGGFAIASTLRGGPPFGPDSPNEALVLAQAFMGVTTLTAIAVGAVVAERKRLEAQLVHQADHDSLTGVLGRRRFQEELARHLAQARRYGTEGALLFLDLDDFKSINDGLGHGAGDKMLSSVATLLREWLRESDLLCRLGGDEFAILLLRADRGQAEAVAGQLLAAIRAHEVVIDGRSVRTTASIGIALLPEHGLAVEEALAHADTAMYRAKEAGRDLGRVYEPVPAADAASPEEARGPRRRRRTGRTGGG
jgi:diguanylate cyclase (GGDEF)-like protein